jgi:superfamily II DNA/RNA helicase
VISKITMPSSVVHWFMTADTADEQRIAITKAIARLLGEHDSFRCNSSRSCSDVLSAAEAAISTPPVLRALFVLPSECSASQQEFIVESVLKPALLDSASVAAVPVVHIRATAKERISMNKAVMEDSGSTSCAFVCVADAARGLNVASLDAVFVLCRSRTVLEYAHLAGRVGRMGLPGVAVSIMPRSFVRIMSSFCDTLDIPFRVERRFQEVDVPRYSPLEASGETN